MKLSNITFIHAITFTDVRDDGGVNYSLKKAKKHFPERPGVYIVKSGNKLLYIGSFKKGVIRRWVTKTDIYHFKKPLVVEQLKQGSTIKVFYQDEEAIKTELGCSDNLWVNSSSIEGKLIRDYSPEWNKTGVKKITP